MPTEGRERRIASITEAARYAFEKYLNSPAAFEAHVSRMLDEEKQEALELQQSEER